MHQPVPAVLLLKDGSFLPEYAERDNDYADMAFLLDDAGDDSEPAAIDTFGLPFLFDFDFGAQAWRLHALDRDVQIPRVHGVLQASAALCDIGCDFYHPDILSL